MVFFNWNFRASDLEASKNKPHQIYVLELQAKEHFQNVNSASAAILSPILTLLQPESLKTQNIKVVELFLCVP